MKRLAHQVSRMLESQADHKQNPACPDINAQQRRYIAEAQLREHGCTHFLRIHRRLTINRVEYRAKAPQWLR